MIRAAYTVHCDGCFEKCNSLIFCSLSHAESWISDNDDDYAEYGQFADGTPRVSEIFHKAGRRLLCKRCVDIEIDRMRKRNDRLQGVLESLS